MKKIILILTILFSISYTKPIYKVGIGTFNIVSPDTLRNGYSSGVLISGSAGKHILTNLDAFINFEFARTPITARDYLEFLNLAPEKSLLTGGDYINIINIGASFEKIVPFNDEANVLPYIIAGAGLHKTSSDDIKIFADSNNVIDIKSVNTTSFYIHFGLGANLLLENTNLFLDINFYYLKTKDNNISFVPIKVGLKF